MFSVWITTIQPVFKHGKCLSSTLFPLSYGSAQWLVIAHSNSQGSGDIYYDPHLIYRFLNEVVSDMESAELPQRTAVLQPMRNLE